MTAKQANEFKHCLYELYKQDWIKSHVHERTQKETLKRYRNTAKQIIEDDIDTKIPTFDEYVEYNGYCNSIYACYDEFIDYEYNDGDYIAELLGNDPTMIKLYEESLNA